MIRAPHLLAAAVLFTLAPTTALLRAAPASPAPDENAPQKIEALRTHVNHIIIIYQENWSFDGLLGKFPGANGIDNAGDAIRQVDKNGKPYTVLPPAMDTRTKTTNHPTIDPDKRIPKDLPVKPYDLAKLIAPDQRTGDLVHRFYEQQYQIDGGKMDKFAAWSDAGGLVMSYYDASDMPLGTLAREFTLCDNTFHAAFGGSFLNHIWLISAATPVFPNAPAKLVAKTDAAGNITNPTAASVTPDGYGINTLQPTYKPHKASTARAEYLPPQTMPTIGDRLTEKNISWAWYSGGWDDALAGKPHANFEFHHQPFVYFVNYADGTPAKKEHLRDEKQFFADVAAKTLPSVVYLKALGNSDEHPSNSSLAAGQQHAADLVNVIRKSDYWKDTVIIITYDENGGRWDHVAPPKGDRWGPSLRVPTVIISPFAKKGTIDSTQYDTTSTLKLIEMRWDLQPLGTRDAAAAGFLNTLEFPK